MFPKPHRSPYFLSGKHVGPVSVPAPVPKNTKKCKAAGAALGDTGLGLHPITPANEDILPTGAAKSAAFQIKNAPETAHDADFAAALAMIAALPLSPAEKTQAVRRLMQGKAAMLAQASTEGKDANR
jgi:hypothetical protein